MISLQEHSGRIAKKVVGRFVEDIPVRTGFSDLFPRETTQTLYVDVEVERDNDLIAVDVLRFTEGNKNKFTRATEKTFVPPYFKEDYDFARDEVYMSTVALGATNISGANQAIAQNALKNVRKNRAKIERAIQKQQAEVLQTGIVELKNGDNIDFGRKAESIVTLAGGDKWDAETAKPIDNLKTAMKFLRNVGHSKSGVINVFMRDTAMNNFLQNEQVIKVADSRRMNRIDIVMPKFAENSGLAFHGQVAAGDFTMNLFTYNESYTSKDGSTEYYLDEGNVIILPGDFMGKTVFGGLPYMRKMSTGGASVMIPGVIEKEFLLRGYDDVKTISSTLELTSAPLVIPFTIDKVYTLKVL
jgi:hypothetical protein